VETIDGRTLVVQRRVDRSDPTDARFRAVRGAVRAAGLPVPEPARAAVVGGQVVVVLPFVDGVVAAELLGSDGDPELVGRLCGEVAARLATVRPAGLPLPRTWASAESLKAAARGWLESLPDAVPAGTRDRLQADVDRISSEVATAPPRFAHGDLAPVNLLVRDGRVAAVLDLDRARLAHPLFDAAWFAWTVSFHHGDVAEAAWAAYARAVGTGVRSPAALAWLWSLQLLERVSEARGEDERATWADRLVAALDHVEDNGGDDDAPQTTGEAG
jgi:aminoglycoside phosphotransferase (APT) family kinase protein